MSAQTPQQPDLPAFVMFDQVPAGCIAFTVPDNRITPHLRAGDIAVVDPTDSAPAIGELFLIQWNDGGRQVVEPIKHPRPEGIEGWDGTNGYWRVRWQMTMVSLSGAVETLRWGDGPYAEKTLTRKLVGRVVGILASPAAAPAIASTVPPNGGAESARPTFDAGAWLAAFTAIGGRYALLADRQLVLWIESCPADALAKVMAEVTGHADRREAIKAAIERRQVGEVVA